MLDIEKLYRSHKNAIRAVILPYEKVYDIVEELMQDTFVAALEAKDSYREEAAPLTWICGIAKNVARNHVRGVMRSVDLVSEAEFVGGDIESYADTLNASNPKDDPAVELEAQDMFIKACEMMPVRMALCVRLRADGLSNEEVAEGLEITTGRVSAYISESRGYFNDS